MKALWRTALLLAPLGLAAACATTKGPPEVKDEWVARIPESEMGPIFDARADVRRSRDELNRAEVAVKDAKRDHDVQKGLQDAEKERLDALGKAIEAARSTGDPAQIRDAQERHARGQEMFDVAKERADVGKGRVEVAELERDLARVGVRRAEVAVEQAEYQQLRAMNDTRIRDLNPAAFEAEFAELTARESELQTRLADQSRSLTFAERRLRELEQRLGVGGAGDQGTLPEDRSVPRETFPEDVLPE